MVNVINKIPNSDTEDVMTLTANDFEYLKMVYIKHEFKGYFEIFGRAKEIKTEKSNLDWNKVDYIKIKVSKLELIPQAGTVIEIFNLTDKQYIIYKISHPIEITE
jgi:hypothetical protein